ncbi:MAG: DUF4338 domain-containing protein, partial [Desulfobacteraceae bacterium]
MQAGGRDFSDSDIEWIRSQVETRPEITRTELSRLVCSYTGWVKTNGGLKEMSCRVALSKLEQKGLIELPRARHRVCLPRIQRTLLGEPLKPFELKAGSVELSLETVDKKTSPLWNELIDRYHYLGYSRLAGAQMRFFVYASGALVCLMGFSSAAWKVAPRDKFIGWSALEREKNLHLIVNNSRFLILPWVSCKYLASRILSHISKRLPAMWEQRYGYRPLLLETFVDKSRFSGTSYKAANWIYVGDTQGRGKWDINNLR